MKNEIQSVTSTGNIYADAGLPDAEILNVKAQLSFRIMDAIKEKGFTQTKFAEIAGISQPRLSTICSSRFDEVSIEAMLKVLSKVGYDVSVVLKPRQEPVTTIKPNRVPTIVAPPKRKASSKTSNPFRRKTREPVEA